MLPDLSLQCPFCQLLFKHQSFIVHVKHEHNFAITRLIQFHDPRYYLALLHNLEVVTPGYLKSAAQPRESDSVMTLNRDQNDDRLRRLAHAFQRLKMLEQLQYERDAKVTKTCLMCDQIIEKVSYQSVLEHYTEEHKLRVGPRVGVVYIQKLLDVINQFQESATCMYCKQKFQTSITLKNHLRTHSHLRFARDDAEFDCFFVDCYRDFGRQRGEVVSDDQDIEEPENVEENEELDEEAAQIPPEMLQIMAEVPALSIGLQDSAPIQCLFCPNRYQRTAIKQHLSSQHSFTFDQLSGSFYDQVKQVNYVRTAVARGQCPWCDTYIDEDHIKQHSTEKLQKIEGDHMLIPVIQGDEILQEIIEEDE